MLPRRAVDPNAVLAELNPRLAGAVLTEIGEGWDNVAWSLESGAGVSLILRIGKTADPVEQAEVTRTDAALLDFVAGHSSLITNRVLAFDPDAGALLLTRVPGVPAQEVTIADPVGAGRVLGDFLRRLHEAIPPAELVASGTQAARWRADTSVAFAAVAQRCSAADRAVIESFLAGPVPAEPARLSFCHNDLGEDHIMVDSDTGLPIGVIDWSDARLTDPAVDFGLVWFDLGVAVVAAALAAYGPVDSDFIDRARWYALHAGIAGVTFRAARDDPHVAAVLARLREVSAEEPGAPRSERHIVDGGDDARHARA